jgi:hypothetical protein
MAPIVSLRELRAWGIGNNELRKIRDGGRIQGFMYHPQIGPVKLDAPASPVSPPTRRGSWTQRSSDLHAEQLRVGWVCRAGRVRRPGALLIVDLAACVVTPEPEIPVFAIARGDDVDLAVALPAAWAVEHTQVQVVFEHWDVSGWHAMVESPDGDRVLSFPWSRHADKMLRGEVTSELPGPALPGGGWDDLEQGWWASVRAAGDAVFIAETDFDRLLDVAGAPVASLSRPGRVELSGVPVLWSRVPRAAWDEAWSIARASCARGAPAPSRAPRGADA